MKLQLSIDVERYKEKPLYYVAVYDLDKPVNFHSYDCVYYKQGDNLKELIENLRHSEYAKAIDNFVKL